VRGSPEPPFGGLPRRRLRIIRIIIKSPGRPQSDPELIRMKVIPDDYDME